MLISCIIDTEEERDVAVIDIPNAFIQTRVDNEKYMVYIRFRGFLVDLMIEIVPGVYGPYVKLDKNGTKLLILQCLNAIYGTMVASLLYYKHFCRKLKRKIFVINPYDRCTANRMVDGKQQTIFWHVDDCMIIGFLGSADLAVINMPQYSLLFTIDYSIGSATIVKINHKIVHL